MEWGWYEEPLQFQNSQPEKDCGDLGDGSYLTEGLEMWADGKKVKQNWLI